MNLPGSSSSNVGKLKSGKSVAKKNAVVNRRRQRGGVYSQERDFLSLIGMVGWLYLLMCARFSIIRKVGRRAVVIDGYAVFRHQSAVFRGRWRTKRGVDKGASFKGIASFIKAGGIVSINLLFKTAPESQTDLSGARVVRK